MSNQSLEFGEQFQSMDLAVTVMVPQARNELWTNKEKKCRIRNWTNVEPIINHAKLPNWSL